MILSKSKIKSMSLIEQPVEKACRKASYDLTVGKIYIPLNQNCISKLGDNIKKGLLSIESDKTLDEYEIPPQGMAVIFSQEKVKVPKEICGIALPKTSLCQEGLLCLNTGIIDPCYHGYISGTIINFSKNPVMLKHGDAFLRLIFHEILEPDDDDSLIEQSDKEYLSVIKNYANNYPLTFMNLPDHIKDITDKVLGKFKTQILVWVSIIAFVFVLINFLVPMFCLNTDKIENNVEKRILESKIPALAAEVDNLKKNGNNQTTELINEIRRLNDNLENLSKSNMAPAKQKIPQKSVIDSEKQAGTVKNRANGEIK